MSANLNSKPLIVLYGPPGVGKLTVAKELNKITNLPLFHNHLSNDLVRSVFDCSKNSVLINKIRLDFFEFAAKNDLGLIFTLVYAFEIDNPFMDELKSIAMKSNKDIFYVQLLCEESQWRKRVSEVDRKNYKKVLDFDLVQKTMTKYDLLTPYSKLNNHFTIDITNLKVEEAANNIYKTIYFK